MTALLQQNLMLHLFQASTASCLQTIDQALICNLKQFYSKQMFLKITEFEENVIIFSISILETLIRRRFLQK